MSDAVAVNQVRNCRTYQRHILHFIANKEMLLEMACFPWKAMDAVEIRAEQDARVKGFATPRQTDDVHVAHVMGTVREILQTGGFASPGQKILLRAYSELERKPRTRGMVLALQALVNAGLPAIIRYSIEPPNEHHDCVGYVADLMLVIPPEP